MVSNTAEIHQFHDKDITINDDSSNNDIALTQRASTGRFQPISQSPASTHLGEANIMLILEEVKTCRGKASRALPPVPIQAFNKVINRSQDCQHLFSW